MKKYLLILARGQTLIETLVTVVVSSLVILGVTGLALIILRNSSTNDNASLALGYAQEGQEYLRNLYKTSPATLLSYDNGHMNCLKDITNPSPVDTSSSCADDIHNVLQSRLLRTFQVQRVSSGNDCPFDSSSSYENVQVNVNVSWSDSTCQPSGSYCHASKLETCLSNAGNL